MKLRTVLSAFLIALASSAVHAQTNEPGQAAPPAAARASARELPPDTKAYQEATRITDPAKKIEALEKFKKDFPDSASVTNANVNILSTLASSTPGQTARIRNFLEHSDGQVHAGPALRSGKARKRQQEHQRQTWTPGKSQERMAAWRSSHRVSQ